MALIKDGGIGMDVKALESYLLKAGYIDEEFRELTTSTKMFKVLNGLTKSLSC